MARETVTPRSRSRIATIKSSDEDPRPVDEESCDLGSCSPQASLGLAASNVSGSARAFAAAFLLEDGFDDRPELLREVCELAYVIALDRLAACAAPPYRNLLGG